MTYDAFRGHQERSAYELTRGRLQAVNAALEEIDQMPNVHFTNPEVLASLRRPIHASAMSPQDAGIPSEEVHP